MQQAADPTVQHQPQPHSAPIHSSHPADYPYAHQHGYPNQPGAQQQIGGQPPYPQQVQQQFDQQVHTPVVANGRGPQIRLALIAAGIALGVGFVLAAINLFGGFFLAYDVPTLVTGFGANLFNLVAWTATAFLILVFVRPLTAGNGAAGLLGPVVFASAAGTGVLFVFVIIATIVRAINGGFGFGFVINVGILAPLVYGITLAGFLAVGAIVASARRQRRGHGQP